jgi:hypothetical protein
MSVCVQVSHSVDAQLITREGSDEGDVMAKTGGCRRRLCWLALDKQRQHHAIERGPR